jgi:hypothetical protein
MECTYYAWSPLTNSEFWQQLVANNTGRTDPLRHRNKLLLLLAGIAGLRESELTLITVGLFVSPTGELREFAVLPDSITRDSYERLVVISHPALKEAFEQYIQWLLQTGINTQPAAHHLGLDPTTPLLVNDKGVSFSMQSRGEGVLSPSAMNKCLDALIKHAGLADIGITRISLIRTAVIEAYRSGMSTTDLMITTGFSAETISTILAMDIEQCSPIADWFTNRQEAKVKRLESFKLRRKYMI